MKKHEINTCIRKFILPEKLGYHMNENIMYKSFDNGYFIKGYLFYSKGDNEMGLKVTYFLTPLFVKEDAITYVLGNEVLNITKKSFFKSEKSVWWNTRKDMQDPTFEKIGIAIAEQAEPVLNKINSAKDFAGIIKRDRKDNIRIYQEVAYSSILFAGLKEQDRLLKGLIRSAENERDVSWVHQIKEDVQRLLNIREQGGRIEILKSWANETIANLKLPHLKPL